MRRVAFWCLVLSLCAAALAGRTRLVVPDDAAAEPRPAANAGAGSFDPKPAPAPQLAVGPGFSAVAATGTKLQPAMQPAAAPRALISIGRASISVAAATRGPAPFRTLQLRI